MRFSPRPPEIGETEGFTEANDIFGYKEFGKRLTNLIDDTNQPLTLILDGPWGSGKSTFVRQWAGDLRANRKAAVVEFNAFANDHHEDAFVPIAAQIFALAKQQLGETEAPVKKFYESAKKLGAAFLPLGARLGIKLGTLGLVSVEEVQAAGEGVKALAEELGNETAKAVENAISDCLQDAYEVDSVLATFQHHLENVAESVCVSVDDAGGAESNFPLVFIIDELDRCRPNFSLSMLERIKHFFSVPGVVFVLVTNLHQLHAAVRGAYGRDTDARLYIEKFYDLRAMLPVKSDRLSRQSSLYLDYLWREMNIVSGDAYGDDDVKSVLRNLAIAKSLSLRTLERVAAYVGIIYRVSEHRFSAIIAGVAVIRQTEPEIYNNLREGRLKWSEVNKSLVFDDWVERESIDEAMGIWHWFTNMDLDADEEVKECKRLGFSARVIRERSTFLPSLLRSIDNFYIE